MVSLNNIKSAFYWAMAVHNSTKGRILTSMKYIYKIEKVRSLQSFEKAFKANLLMMSREFDEAEYLYRSIISDLDDNENDNVKYTKLFCTYIISELDGDVKLQNELLSSIRLLHCNPVLLRWLPL